MGGLCCQEGVVSIRSAAAGWHAVSELRVVMRVDGDVVLLRVPREKVVRAARLAIKRARRRHEIDRDLRSRLMTVAREAPEFALGTWRVDGRCGCLVGNLLRYHESEAPDLPSFDGSLYWIGVFFDEILRESLTSGQLARFKTETNARLARVVARVAG